MNTVFQETLTSLAPTQTEMTLAQDTSRQLTELLNGESEYRLQLATGDKPGKWLTVPASAIHLLSYILSEMAQGNPVTLMPIHAELPVSKAAEILNVSVSYMDQLLETDEIPFREINTLRYIPLLDLMAYKMSVDTARLNVLDELAAQAQELDMGY